MPDAGETDLTRLLATMRPAAREGEWVVVSVTPEVADAVAAGEEPAARIVEDEGVTLVLRREQADAHGIPYDFVGAWITLRVHSSLSAVGLTAAVATALTRRGISCNVLAGHFHDHLLVPVDDRDRALHALEELATAEWH